jgi:integrase
MPVKWISTKYKGVRFYEHPARKHGVKKDHYLAIRYQKEGQRKEEGIGWTSERDPEDNEHWTEAKAALVLEKLKGAAKHGKKEAPVRLSEKREIAEQERQEQAEAKELAEREAITFNQFYKDNYLSVLTTSKKSGSVHAEKILYEKWIKPHVGAMPFKNIFPLHIEKIKKAMTDESKSPRSIEYVLSIVRQIWNLAKRDGLIDRESPTKQVKKLKVDNKRVAFFNHEQADTLLNALRDINKPLQKKFEKTQNKIFKVKAEQLHNMTLLSLHTGMRAGEIFKLRWADLNMDEGIITINDAKGGSGVAYITNEVKAMFKKIRPEENHANELIFKTDEGMEIKQTSNSFDNVIDTLKFNDGITDRRQRLTFHSCRHTFASWLVLQGTPLYTVQKLMRHKSISLTERYAHLAPDTLRAAVSAFEKNLKMKQKKSKAVNV